MQHQKLPLSCTKTAAMWRGDDGLHLRFSWDPARGKGEVPLWWAWHPGEISFLAQPSAIPAQPARRDASSTSNTVSLRRLDWTGERIKRTLWQARSFYICMCVCLCVMLCYVWCYVMCDVVLCTYYVYVICADLRALMISNNSRKRWPSYILVNPHIQGDGPLLGGKTENVKSYRRSWKIWKCNVLVTSTYVSSTPAICTKTSGSLLKVSSTFDPLVLWRKARQINPDWFLQIMFWEPTTVCQHRSSTHSAAWTSVTLTSASWKRRLRKPKFQQMICRLRSQRFCRNLKTPKAC